MGYTSGHYRKGHFRNGKWVSGGYVKGHYRSDISSGYTWTPTNITVSDLYPNDDDNLNSEGLTGEDYLNSRREFWRKELGKDKADPLITEDSVMEEEGVGKNKKRKRKKKNNIVLTIIVSIIFLGIMIAILSAGEEVVNWVLAILFILALMKAGIMK